MAHSPSDWIALREVLTGFECAWADVDGWHEGACPHGEPIGATHLWGWRDDALLVVRLGGSHIVCSELRLGDGTASGDDQLDVSVSSHDASVWAEGEDGIALPSRYTQFQLLAAEGVSTVWFVRPR